MVVPSDCEWLTVEEVCDELRISRHTFYRWRMLGHAPPAIRLPNGELRVHRGELETWIANLG